ncbi:MAG: LuxR C-terminal-related transcriptional regulator [Lentihominibacter sp.]
MDYNRIQLFNNAVYQIYNIEDFESMKREVLNTLKHMIPNRCGTFLMAGAAAAGGSGSILHSPVCLPEKFLEMEYRYASFEDRDFSSWILRKSRAMLVRITDLMDDETRMGTEIYKNCFLPYGLHYCVDLTIISRGELLGCLTLYRSREDEDFSDDDLEMMKMLSDHLNARFSINKYGSVQVHKTGIGRIGDLISRYDLTKREAEVLNRILQGATNNQICEELFISPNTLKKHLHNLYAKAGVRNRVQLLGIDSSR